MRWKTQIEQGVNYPDNAKKENTQGTVVLSYSINTQGEIVDIAVSIGSVDQKHLQDELIRVLEESGPWIPGKEGDKNTKMKLAVSYDFKLN